MPHFAVVVADPDVAHEREIARNVEAHAARWPSVARSTLVSRVAASVGPKRREGDLHTVVASECPQGLPNCRNCGDPAYAESCRAAGHCPACGTKHGVAPESVVKANGYALVAVDPPGAADEWDRSSRRFVPRGLKGGA